MKRKKGFKFKDAKTKKRFIDSLTDLYTDDLMYILENIGEDAFRNNAKYLGLTEKVIDEIIEMWRDVIEKEKFYLDFITPPPFFNLNDENSIKLLFSPKNITWRSIKNDKSVRKENLPKYSRDEIIEEKSILFDATLSWTLEKCGESEFRKVAKWLHYSEKKINEYLKHLKDVNKNEKI